MPSTSTISARETATTTFSLTSALLHIAYVRAPPSYPRMLTKTTATASLAAFAALRGAPRLAVAALALCTVGDAFLAWDGDANFLAGLCAFLAAQTLYMLLFARAGAGARWAGMGWRAGVVGMVLVGGGTAVLTQGMVAALAAALASRVESGLRLPIAVYSVAVLAMVLAALTVAGRRIAVGALLFAASDTILGADKFLVGAGSAHRPWMQHAVWLLYYAGQMLIALAGQEMTVATKEPRQTKSTQTEE